MPTHRTITVNLHVIGEQNSITVQLNSAEPIEQLLCTDSVLAHCILDRASRFEKSILFIAEQFLQSQKYISYEIPVGETGVQDGDLIWCIPNWHDQYVNWERGEKNVKMWEKMSEKKLEKIC